MSYEESAKDKALEIIKHLREEFNMGTHEAKFHCKNEDQKVIVEKGCEWIQMLLHKNQNYGSSVFKRPILVPDIPASAAILIRMSDKIERLKTLLNGNMDLVGESISDTINDLGAYCLLWVVAQERDENVPVSE